MKKILFLFFILAGCTQIKPVTTLPDAIDSTSYYKAKCDSITTLAMKYETYLVSYENRILDKNDSIQVLSDSILKLNVRPLMSTSQFLNLYKYERLLKYYKICKNKPTQWKYYKGWSTRVFEN